MEADPFPPAAEGVDRANRVQALLVVDVDPDEQVVVVPAVAAAVVAVVAAADVVVDVAAVDDVLVAEADRRPLARQLLETQLQMLDWRHSLLVPDLCHGPSLGCFLLFSACLLLLILSFMIMIIVHSRMSES